jgi:D-glycero-D-manno-heptose 1,7-bisphosphate phosphatase
MNRAAFLDRDGVINRKARKGEYVTCWEEMLILPGVAEAIAMLNKAAFRVIVVTNQRCVVKGLITTADLETLHNRMCGTLASSGARIDAVYYCPHEVWPECGCRKPAPGMLLAAARAHDLDLAASWMIGDSESDVAAGRNAGCKSARLLSSAENADRRADVGAASLLGATRQILRLEKLMADGRKSDSAPSECRASNAAAGIRCRRCHSRPKSKRGTTV